MECNICKFHCRVLVAAGFPDLFISLSQLWGLLYNIFYLAMSIEVEPFLSNGSIKKYGSPDAHVRVLIFT
jgi:hypothetical protein